MLSRVAERMFWFGRYLERAENTSRLVNVNANLLLDLPVMVSQIWRGLITITGSDEIFGKSEARNEANVTRFLLADKSNPGSLLASVRMMRENVRTTREIMPSEAWERINEFYLFVSSNLEKGLSRRGRYEFLSGTISYCQQINGLLLSNMSHGVAYNFIRIGRNLERADMTTRILNVGCMDLLTHKAEVAKNFDNILWMNVLRSLSAYQMYRQHVKDRVNGEDVVQFLLKNEQFPRTVAHCLGEVYNCLSVLPRNDIALRAVSRTQRLLSDSDVVVLLAGDLHQFIDQLQKELAEISGQVSQTWFQYSPESLPTTQHQIQSQTSA